MILAASLSTADKPESGPGVAPAVGKSGEAYYEHSDDSVTDDFSSEWNYTRGRQTRILPREKPRRLLSASYESLSRPSNRDQLVEELESLRLENERLKAKLEPEPEIPATLSYRPHIFYCLNDDKFYLDEPRWEAGGPRPVLRSSNPIRNVGYYIDQHPEVAFFFKKYYSTHVPGDVSQLETSDGVFRAPIPVKQTLSLVASAMIEALEHFVRRVPGFTSFFENFDPRDEINEPYLFMFYSIPHMQEALSGLDPQSRKLFELLYQSIDSSHGLEYAAARTYASEGRTSSRLVQYLIQPGEVLVDLAGPMTRAYLALDWAKPDFSSQRDFEEEVLEYQAEHSSIKKGSRAHTKQLRFGWTVPVTYWSFDGNFERTRINLSLTLDVGHESETFLINTLEYVPLGHTPTDVPKTLERRGNTFWSLRFRRYITYRQPSSDNLDSSEERYFIDISTYRKLQPHSRRMKKHLRADLTARDMASDEPPQGYSLLLFPPTIIGYNMLHKTWCMSSSPFLGFPTLLFHTYANNDT
jgi:hypothetical protein